MGSLLPLQLAQGGHRVTVCDVRCYPEKHSNLKAVTGDFLTHPFAEGEFDFLIMVSTIEHIGFGHYGDPVVADGDLQAMKKVHRLLNADGKAVLTIPFTKQHRIIGTLERWYDAQRLACLLDGYHLEVLEWWVPVYWVLGRCLRWMPATLEMARDSKATYGYHATACLVAVKRPNQPSLGRSQLLDSH